MEIVSSYNFDLFSCLFPPRSWLKSTEFILCFDHKRGCWCVFPLVSVFSSHLHTNLRHLPLYFSETIMALHIMAASSKTHLGSKALSLSRYIQCLHKQELQIRQHLSPCWGSLLAFLRHFQGASGCHHLVNLTILQAIKTVPDRCLTNIDASVELSR